MSQTIKIDILNESVFKLLESLESLKLIKLHSAKKTEEKVDFIKQFKGKLKLSSKEFQEFDQYLKQHCGFGIPKL